MRRHQVSTTRIIPADRQALFDLVADPSMHPKIDGSGTVMGLRSDADRLELGARFGMDMRMGFAYRITNTVVEFEEGHLIAWRHFHGHRWRYRFEDVTEGTVVEHTFDWSGARSKLAIELLGAPAKNLRAMRATLARLEQIATERDGADDATAS